MDVHWSVYQTTVYPGQFLLRALYYDESGKGLSVLGQTMNIKINHCSIDDTGWFTHETNWDSPLVAYALSWGPHR